MLLTIGKCKDDGVTSFFCRAQKKTNFKKNKFDKVSVNTPNHKPSSGPSDQRFIHPSNPDHALS